MNSLRDTAPFALLSATLLATLSACGPSAQPGDALPGADTTCAANSAQLAVGDGFQEILCGCAEPGGTVIASGTGVSVTCTIPVGTQVFFYYIGTKTKHQIMAADGVSFPSGPVSDPTDSVPVRVTSFQLTAAGSYPYNDAYDAGISGTLVAQ
jgi:hypothetical protein